MFTYDTGDIITLSVLVIFVVVCIITLIKIGIQKVWGKIKTRRKG